MSYDYSITYHSCMCCVWLKSSLNISCAILQYSYDASLDSNLLTDSGGFQMVSLLELAEIKEEGVLFQSPVDGSQMLLTPEKSIQLQNQIGADIMMV